MAITDKIATERRNLSPAALYEHAIRRIGPTATLLEWDDSIPSFHEVHAEALKAEKWLDAKRLEQTKVVTGTDQQVLARALLAQITLFEEVSQSVARRNFGLRKMDCGFCIKHLCRLYTQSPSGN